jgi:uncharacterized membrane protein YeaQ/YmgE (transglycosylase-associated protein family)
MFLGILGWVVVGLIVGFVASRVVDQRGDDPRFGIALSVGTALIAGWLFSVISGSTVSLLNVWALVTTAIAAVVVMTVWHIVRHRAPYKAPIMRRSY